MPRSDVPLAPRLAFIDAARGVAVLLVFLSHFGSTYFSHASENQPVPWLLFHFGMVASPTFIIISGALLGFLFRSAAGNFSRVRAKIIDRALFLLSFGHALILFAHLPHSHSVRWLFVTDASGVAMLAGALTIQRLSVGARLWGSLTAYVLSWVVVTTWSPGTFTGLMIKETLFGSITSHFYLYAFPLVPWMAVYFASTVLGERLAESDAGRTQSKLAWFCAGSVAIALVARALRIGLGEATTPLTAMFSISQKAPPGPAYLFLFGGLTFGVLYGCRRIGTLSSPPALFSLLIRLGRTALFAFVAQYYVYDVFVSGMAHHPLRWWPVVGLVTIAGLVAASQAWWRWDGNRFITVGYSRWETPPLLALREAP